MQVMMASLSLLLLLLVSISTTSDAFNITEILDDFPEFSTFNNYLSRTHLDVEINNRNTITVCAVNNTAMSAYLDQNPPKWTIKYALYFHVFLDYYGSARLHQLPNGSAISTTLFQASGKAEGGAGSVNITNLGLGKIGFGSLADNGKVVSYLVKTVVDIPWQISVLQVSTIIPAKVSVAPTPPSQVNLTSIMSDKGCKFFATTLLTNLNATKAYKDAIQDGLTIFCPVDEAMKDFLPKYYNFTETDRTSFLEFFAVPYYESMLMMHLKNGVRNTLATWGAQKFNFNVQNVSNDGLALTTGINTVQVSGPLTDEDPLAIYSINKVLLPEELYSKYGFLASPPAPAPAPVPAGSPPKGHDGKEIPSSEPAADSPENERSDKDDEDNAGGRVHGGRGAVILVSLWLGCLLVL